MNWPAIEYDDGYPTDESMDAIQAMPFGFLEAPIFVREALADCAENCCASYSEEEAGNIVGEPVIHGYFSTGGWSGAESLIHLIESRFDTRYSMLQWRRGGHYIFEFPMKEPTA
jgi:hypothetical protein